MDEQPPPIQPEPKPPIQVRILSVATLAASVGCLIYALWPSLYASWIYLLAGAGNEIGVVLWWVALALFGGFSCRMLMRRKTNAPIVALFFWTLALGSLVRILPHGEVDLFFGSIIMNEPMSPVDRFLASFSTNLAAIGQFLGGLCVFGIVARFLVFSESVRSWYGGSQTPDKGFASTCGMKGSPGLWRRFWLGAKLGLMGLAVYVFLGLLFQLVWFEISDVLNPDPYGWEFSGRSIFEWPLALLPFVTACGIVAWALGERLIVEQAGVRLFLFEPKYSLFFAPWSRIRIIDRVKHRKRAESLVVHYRSWLLIPFAFEVDAKRFVEGGKAVEAVVEQAKERGVRIRPWYSPDWMPIAAWAVIFIGAGLIESQQQYSAYLMRLCNAEEFPIKTFAEIAAPLQLGGLYLASILFFGVGLGLLSAYHRGGARPFMMALWIFVSRMIPTPFLHWLVWIAMYAILLARYNPAVPLVDPSFPAGDTLVWGMTMINLGPLVAGLGYLAGVLLGRRKLAPEPAVVAASSPETSARLKPRHA